MKLFKYSLLALLLILFFRKEANAQCRATFIDSSVGLTVTFTSTSTGTSPTSTYYWRFGDGSFDTNQNPIHTYAAPGSYSVGLEVSDTANGGCFDSVYNLVIVPSGSGCQLIASFTQTINGLTVNFTNTSTGVPTGAFYQWHFGDGSPTINSQNPTYTYAMPGTYNVDVIVSYYDSTLATGCIDTAYATIVVGQSSNCNINAAFTETISGLSVSLNSTSTGAIFPATYNWDFGDGNIGTGATTSHIYSSSGVYSIKLIVSDSICADSISRIIGITANVFTPNGDGIDDVFSIPCGSAGGLVYDRFGSLVKTLASGSLFWDGSNDNGGIEPTGLFFILCNGTASPISVTLIR